MDYDSFKLLIAIALATSACAYPEPEDETVAKHVNRFIEVAEQLGEEVNTNKVYGLGFTLEELPEGIGGVCELNKDIETDPQNPKKVKLSEEVWKSTTDTFQEYLIFHEIGHCYLCREHDDETKTDGVGESMMNAGASEGLIAAYESDPSEYHAELFAERADTPDPCLGVVGAFQLAWEKRSERLRKIFESHYLVPEPVPGLTDLFLRGSYNENRKVYFDLVNQ